MMPKPLSDGGFSKLCWVVPDIHAAMDAWLRIAGVGPFFVFDKVIFDEPRYRGMPTECVDITAAMAQAGDFQLELVSQNDRRPSFFRDVVAAGRTSLHHMARYCDDYDAELAAHTQAGATVAFCGLMMGSRVCWLDAQPGLGFMIELIEKNERIAAVFDSIKASALDWDGSEPVRRLG